MNANQNKSVEALLDEKEVASILGVKPSALQAWRWRGGGPLFVRVGRCIRYRRNDVESWLDARTCANTAQEFAE